MGQKLLAQVTPWVIMFANLAPCKGKSFKNSRQYTKLLPLQGALPIAIIPRALPWAKSFCPFRACCFWKLLGLQPVHKPLAKLQLKRYLPSIYGSPR